MVPVCVLSVYILMGSKQDGTRLCVAHRLVAAARRWMEDKAGGAPFADVPLPIVVSLLACPGERALLPWPGVVKFIRVLCVSDVWKQLCEQQIFQPRPSSGTLS